MRPDWSLCGWQRDSEILRQISNLKYKPSKNTALALAEGNYNIFEMNEALFAFDESLLGA